LQTAAGDADMVRIRACLYRLLKSLLYAGFGKRTTSVVPQVAENVFAL